VIIEFASRVRNTSLSLRTARGLTSSLAPEALDLLGRWLKEEVVTERERRAESTPEYPTTDFLAPRSTSVGRALIGYLEADYGMRQFDGDQTTARGSVETAIQ